MVRRRSATQPGLYWTTLIATFCSCACQPELSVSGLPARIVSASRTARSRCNPGGLEKSDDLTMFVEIDLLICRPTGQPGHCHDLACDNTQVACTSACSHFADRNLETPRPTLHARVV